MTLVIWNQKKLDIYFPSCPFNQNTQKLLSLRLLPLTCMQDWMMQRSRTMKNAFGVFMGDSSIIANGSIQYPFQMVSMVQGVPSGVEGCWQLVPSLDCLVNDNWPIALAGQFCFPPADFLSLFLPPSRDSVNCQH